MGAPGVLQSVVSQTVGHDSATEQPQLCGVNLEDFPHESQMATHL